MPSLLDQELAEANAELASFAKASSNASFLLGSAVLLAVAAPVILGLLYALKPASLPEGIVLCVVLVSAWAGYGWWWRIRASRAFEVVRACGIKLERSGFSVYVKPGLLQPTLNVTSATDTVAANHKCLDFERLTQRVLRASLD
ncbi:hypothetical protein [Piscinibacter defluvii]|uniref:hypothetical protein n=1 Tax=Piscinibacter defluvii TaxID=1796922 RepID=UPI000FDD4A59|nr:hypothetical protein [Piscinibacter defluvii]